MDPTPGVDNGEGAQARDRLTLLALPPELIIQILNDLPQETKALTLPLVSRSWRAAVYRMPELWLTVSVYCSRSFLTQVHQHRFTAMQQLDAHASELTDDDLRTMLVTCKLGTSLLDLNLTICHNVTD